MQLLLGIALISLITTVSGQAQNIVNALKIVQSNIWHASLLVYYFNGNPYTGTLDAVSIQQQTVVIGNAVEYATRVADASPLLNGAGSEAVAAAVIDLRPDVEGLLKNVASKKWAFDNVVVGLFSVSKQVQKTLVDQKALTAALGTSLAQKLSGAYREAASLLLNEFSSAFDSAIAAYVNQVP